MYWITDNPWPLLILLVGAAVCCWVVLEKSRSTICGGLLVAATAVWWIEAAIVTPGEQVEAQLQQMLDAFVADDLPSIQSQISDSAPELRTIAEDGLKLVQLHRTFHLKDIQTELSADGSTAVASLRANGTMELKRSDIKSHVATRWETTWQLESESWKLIEVKRLDVMSGEEIDVLAAR